MLNRIRVVTMVLSCFFANVALSENDWQINLKNADISAFIGQVSDITGKSFVIDPRVKGKVNVLSNEPMDKKGVYELFLSVLRVHGYSALPAGDVTLIVQQNEIKQQGAGINSKAGKNSQEVVTKVIAIKNTPALDLVPILRPLVAKYGHLAGVRSANAIIISDHSRNIARIEQIINRLDTSGVAELEVIQLKEAWVGNVVRMLQSLDPSKVANGNSNNASRTAGSIRVVADERSNRLIIKGEKSARARIRTLIKQLDQPSYFSGSAQVLRLQYADAKKLADLLKGLLNEAPAGGKDAQKVKGKSAVHADEDLNALVVRAEPSLLKEIKSLVAELDVRRTQVLIEAAIVEVSGKIGDALGVQWASAENGKPVVGTNFTEAGTSLASAVGSVVTKTAPKIAAGLTLGAIAGDSSKPSFAVLVQALAGESRNNLLSTPSIMTLDNQEAEIVVGQNVPFRTGSSTSSGGSSTNPFTTIKRQDIGVRLKVKPHVHDGDAVRLEVEATQESVTRDPIQGSSDIATDKSSIKTTILADNEGTVVLGGLIRDDIKEIESKVPLLGDIPLLGWLFKSKSVTKEKKNLMLFLRPTIIKDSRSSKAVTEDTFNGIWEFSLSERLGVDQLNERIDGMFDGKPVARESIQEDDEDASKD